MTILVLGGAGYIGSHTVYKLIEDGYDVAVADNFQTGHIEAIHPEARFYEGDIRDYIHVTDLAAAHVLAMEYLAGGGDSDVFNLGNGVGFSVAEIIDKARAVTGHEIPSVMEARRPGDPAVLVASNEKARRVLGWEPEFDDIERIIETAWRRHENHPEGYQS